MRLSLLLSLFLAASLHAQVAILVDDDLPVLGGTPALQPFKAAEALRQRGLSVTELSAMDLADPQKLSVAKFPVLVLWNGNAFPQPAFANLRAFHAAGGVLVLNGVPFTHPCARRNGQWIDLGHHDFFRHGPEGMGTGGFGGTGKKPGQLIVPENPLGLQQAMLPQNEARLQWYEPGKLPEGDSLTPLVQIRTDDGKTHDAAVIVRHGCPDFRGACDLWLGLVAGGRDEGDRFLAEQMLVRGVLWALHERGLLKDDEWNRQRATLDQIKVPGPLPSGLVYHETPRPWGDTFLPKSKTPARHLLAIPFDKLTGPERIAVTCLQGLTSREQPRLWLLRNKEDRVWLEWHKTQGHIDSYEIISDWTSLFKESAASIHDAVIADPQLYRGDLLAVNVAACEDAIVATPELAERLGLAVKIDLRGKFATYAEGQRWLWATYKDRLSHHLADYFVPRRMTEGTFAYQYQWRAPLVWPCGAQDERQPGSDRFTEKRAVAEMFAEMSPNSPILGFPAGGEGVGLGEPPGVELSSRYARPLVCSDNLANLCVTSGVRLDRLEQPAAPAPPPLDRSKIYVALVMSDGDNLNAWLAFFRRYFEDPSFGKFPLAFGMGPAIREVLPATAQWYFERLTPRNEIICDVSGAGYMQPPHYALGFADREPAWSGFFDWTARMMPPLGMRTIRTVEGEDDMLARYARALPFCHSFFADMGAYTGHHGINNLTYTLPGGMPVFRAATTWRNFGGGPIGEIREQVGTQRPAFVNGFIHCWTFKPEDIARIVAEAGPDIVFVTPSQLAALYREAAAN